jgi:hypothetical protein
MTKTELLDKLIEKAGQAQIVRMFRNSAMDADEKLAVLEREIAEIKIIILEMV